jgi:hypothetical protein
MASGRFGARLGADVLIRIRSLDLTFRFPRNAALFASYFDETDMLDVGTAMSRPATVHCRILMTVAEPRDLERS